MFLQKFTNKEIILITSISILLAIVVSSVYFKVSDEANWVSAGKDFRNAIIDLRPDKTYISAVSHRLGVTVLWVSAFVYSIFGWLPINQLVIVHRFIYLIINTSLFGIVIIILKRYSKISGLLLFVLYMLLNRFFPILGRSTWLDQFLTIFGFLSILFWLKYLTERKLLYLTVSGLFIGLTMLTKYAGWWFPVIIIGLSVIYSYKNNKKFSEIILPLLSLFSVSTFVFILFYPAVWVDPKKVLFLRFEDRSAPLKEVTDVWLYFKEVRLIDPILVLGFIFSIFDWRSKTKDFVSFIGLAGCLYISIYFITFIILLLLGRLNYSFLEGIYRYTYPAIMPLALFTFTRCEKYLRNKNLRVAVLLFIFTREIIFSPILLF